MRFADTASYLDFWREHPAFRDAWTPRLEEYLAYDLVDDGAGSLRPATSYATTLEDSIDQNTGSTLPDALAGLRHPVRFLTAPRGLRDEEPGLYAPAHLANVLAQHRLEHDRIDGVNHYTIVMSDAGADAVAEVVRGELAAAG